MTSPLFAPTADYALSNVNDTILIAIGTACGVVAIGVAVALFINSLRPARPTRAEKIADAQCRHPSSPSADWGKVEPLSDGWWICVCPNPMCQAKFEAGHIFPGPGQGRNLTLAEVRAEHSQWQHTCNT